MSSSISPDDAGDKKFEREVDEKRMIKDKSNVEPELSSGSKSIMWTMP